MAMAVDNAALSRLAQVAPIQKKPGLFGRGGKGRNFLADFAGYFGDQLAGTPIYAQTQADRRDMLADEQRRADERRQSMQDWVAKQQWMLEHQPPEQGTETERFLDAYNDPNTPPALRRQYEALLFPPRPMQVENPETGEVRTFMVNPFTQGTAPQPQGFDTLPEGYTIRKPGGAGSDAPRPF